MGVANLPLSDRGQATGARTPGLIAIIPRSHEPGETALHPLPLPENTSMTRIQIFESARSEAGRNASSRLDAMAEIARAREQGADIEHYEFASDAAEFLRDAQVKAYIDTVGADALPLVLVDGRQALAGRYPTRAELARWSGLSVVAVRVDSGNCCSGGNCG